MRRLASFLLLGLALQAGAAEIWRWKDANGVVHYSDSPVAGAEKVVIGQSRTGTPVTQPPPLDTGSASAAPPPPRAVPYTRCAVTAPTNDEVFHAVDAVSASILIEPALQAGHRLRISLNGGALLEWPETATSYTLTGLYRGSYTLQVRVLGGNDQALCTGPVSNFHVRQPSVLSPARQPAKPPPKKP